jgi:uncharacterized protein YhaN
MKLRGWQVDGFGILHDQQTTELGDGLTVVFGPNEAGKSTLLAFLRGMLFGFGGRADGSRYRPAEGGRHGGRIELEDAEGRLVLDRDAGPRRSLRVTRPDGRPASEADLRVGLGTIDEATFRTTFAFGLGELQALDTLPEQDLRERILSAAIAGSGRSARDAIGALEARADAYLPRRGGPIRALTAELEALHVRLTRALAVGAEYPELWARQLAIQEEVDTFAARIEAARVALNRNRLLVECWPDAKMAREAERELASLLATVEFPADPEGALAAANRALAAARGTLRELRAAQAATEQAMGEFHVDAALAAVASEFDALEGAIPDYRGLLALRDASRDRVETADRLLDEHLAALGPAWREDRLTGDRLPGDRRAEIEEWRRRLEAVAADVAAGERKLAAATTQLAELNRSQDEVRVEVQALQLSDEPPSRTELDARRSAIRRLRTTLAGYRDAEATAAGRQAIVDERERALAQPEGDGLTTVVPRWVTPAAMIAAVGAGGVAAGRLIVGDVAGTVAFVLLAATAELVALGAKAVARRLDQYQSRGERAVAVRTLELADAVRARDEGLVGLETSRTTLLAEASQAGLEGTPTPEAIDGLDAAVALDATARERWDELFGRLVEIHGRMRAAEAKIADQESQLAATRQAEADVRSEWEAWQAVFEASRVLWPAEAIDFLDRIDASRALIADRETERAEIVRLDAEAATWEERARAALVASGSAGLAATAGLLVGDALIRGILDVRGRCLEDARARAALANLQDTLLQRRPEIAGAETKVAEAEARLGSLFASVGVASEIDFQERLKLYHRQNELRALIRELESRLIARLGHGPDADLLRDELAQGRMAAWSAAADAAAAELAAASAGRDDALRRHRDVDVQQRAAEQNDEVATLRLEIEALRSSLADQVVPWRTAMVAASLVERALSELVAKRQPAVVADASRMFAAMTLGRYRAIEQDEAGQTIQVIEAGGTRRLIDELSRGTAEQLYLALRLGLVADHARQGAEVPVVMDDVLVNFDEDRAQAVMDLLTEFSRKHQVLLFTCHRATLDLVRKSVPDVGLVELGRTAEEPARPAARRRGTTSPRRARPDRSLPA